MLRLLVTIPLLVLQACTPPPPPPPLGPPVPLSGASGAALVLFATSSRAAGRDGEPVDLSVLVPLACRDQSQLTGGFACLGMVPEGSTLALEGGERVTPGMRGRPYCQGRSARTEGLVLEQPEDTPGYAVWPPSALKAVKPIERGAGCRGWCRFDRTGHPRVRIKPAVRRRLLKAARRHGLESGPETLEVVQEVTVDLDGDGKPEQLYSVAVPDGETDAYDFSFSALFVVHGTKRPRLLLRRDSHAVVLRGTVDLDRDGRRELWLLLSPTVGVGDSWVVLARDPRSIEVIGAYSCDPR